MHRARTRSVQIGLLLMALLGPFAAQACELRMVYRPEARPPLMAEAPDDSGVYKTLYERASQLIGCKLHIVRLPKVRALRALQTGEADFYPGMDFDAERSGYALFMANGLPGGSVGLSHPDLPTVQNLDDLAGRRVLIAAGQPDRLQAMSPAARSRVHEVRMISASLESAVEMLVRRRADFFIYTQQSVEHLLSHRPELQASLKLHPQCCGGSTSYHLGFSKASSHVVRERNPSFDASKALSPDNQTERSTPGSTAARFGAALERLIRQGEVQRLYRQATATP